MTEKRNGLTELLSVFDGLSLSNAHERRMAFKPLHDFFQILVREVGTTFLGLDKNSLSIYQIKTRWENAKILLSYIEDPKIWDSLINEVNNIRQKVEHDDYYDPKRGDLERIREEAPRFADWVARVGREYYLTSKKLGFKESFYRTVELYLAEADGIIRQHGDKAPYVIETDYPGLSGKDAYGQIRV